MNLHRSRKSTLTVNEYLPLENRHLLAGNVNVFQFDSSLFIRGDVSDNQVEISERITGDIQVIGLDGTTVNDGLEPFIVPADGGEIEQDLRVHLGQGNDSIFVDGIQVNGRAVVLWGPWIGFNRILRYPSTG